MGPRKGKKSKTSSKLSSIQVKAIDLETGEELFSMIHTPKGIQRMQKEAFGYPSWCCSPAACCCTLWPNSFPKNDG